MILNPNTIRLIAHSGKYLNPPKTIWVTDETCDAPCPEVIYGHIQNPQITKEEYVEALNEIRILASKRRHPLKESLWYPIHAVLVEQTLEMLKNSREYSFLARTLFLTSIPIKMRYDIKVRLANRKSSTLLTEKFSLNKDYETAVSLCLDEPSLAFKVLSKSKVIGDPNQDSVECGSDHVIPTEPLREDVVLEVDGEINLDSTSEMNSTSEMDSGEITLGGVLFKVAQGSTLKIGKVACGSISSKGLKSLSIDKVVGGVLYGLSVNH